MLGFRPFESIPTIVIVVAVRVTDAVGRDLCRYFVRRRSPVLQLWYSSLSIVVCLSGWLTVHLPMALTSQAPVDPAD